MAIPVPSVEKLLRRSVLGITFTSSNKMRGENSRVQRGGRGPEWAFTFCRLQYMHSQWLQACLVSILRLCTVAAILKFLAVSCQRLDRQLTGVCCQRLDRQITGVCRYTFLLQTSIPLYCLGAYSAFYGQKSRFTFVCAGRYSTSGKTCADV